MDLDAQKYPIGKYKKPNVISSHDFVEYNSIIGGFPERLEAEVNHLTDRQLDTPYREGGWTVRQLIHHLSDSHMNALVRVKLALTEDLPTAVAYKEGLWAELPDSKTLNIQYSLIMLEGIHAKWSLILTTISPKEAKRCFVHPEHGREISVEEMSALYAWHCNHHLAHITNLKKREGWE
uniref:YfiT family bacillithiol transferase n=1 Tax=Fulvivirga sp. TaxID=1931237 RepID=UPI00404A58C8